MEEERVTKITDKKIIHEGKWLNFEHWSFTMNNKPGVYEVITRNMSGECFGAKAIVIGRSKESSPQLILIANYRIPVENYVLEFPAGLLDKGESLEACALREVKEETGYTGKIVKEIKAEEFIVYTDPWKSNDNETMFIVEVDLDAEENLHPVQNLDGEETIEVLKLDIKNLMEEIKELVDKRKCSVDSCVWIMSIALSMKQKMGIIQFTSSIHILLNK